MDVGTDGVWRGSLCLWSMQRFNNRTTTASGYVSHFSFSPPDDHRVCRSPRIDVREFLAFFPTRSLVVLSIYPSIGRTGRGEAREGCDAAVSGLGLVSAASKHRPRPSSACGRGGAGG